MRRTSIVSFGVVEAFLPTWSYDESSLVKAPVANSSEMNGDSVPPMWLLNWLYYSRKYLRMKWENVSLSQAGSGRVRSLAWRRGGLASGFYSRKTTARVSSCWTRDEDLFDENGMESMSVSVLRSCEFHRNRSTKGAELHVFFISSHLA
jgi:hypothetical protein